MMFATPRVSVLLPVYNGETYLRQTIESILNQTWSDFEFIIINDGSRDNTAQIIVESAGRDARIRYFDQPNRGLIATLNRGIELARGEFLARIDADDLAMPQRLTKQVRFLEQHPDVGILGTARQVINAKGAPIEIKRLPESDLQIRWLSLLACPFAHPSVMIRRNVLLEHTVRYDPAFVHIEDYELWTRLLKRTRGANLPEPLIQYRVYANSVSMSNRAFRMHQHDLIAHRTIHEQLGKLSITLQVTSLLRELLVGGGDPLPDLSNRVGSLAHQYLDLFDAFARQARGHAKLNSVKRDVALNAARILWRFPSARAVPSVLARLLVLDPLLPLVLIRVAPGVWYRRLRRVIDA